MKAAVLEKVGNPLVLKDVPVPEIADDEVLIETVFCGICGTDLHMVNGFGYVPRLPHIPGHEPSGIVKAVGSAVREFAPGDRVVPHLFIRCERCWYCMTGRDNMCAELKGMIGVLSNGALAEYFKAPAKNLFILPERVPLEFGALAADAIVTSVHAVYDRAGSVEGEKTVAVIGAGGVGQIIIQILKHLGPTVVAVSRSEQKLGVAKEMGADHAFKAGEEALLQGIRGLDPDGADIVFDCVGSAESMRDAMLITKRCGRIVMIGEERVLFPADSTRLAQSEIELIGSRNGTRKNMRLGLELLAQGRIKPLISDVYELSQVNEALGKVRQGAAGRVVVKVGTGRGLLG